MKKTLLLITLTLSAFLAAQAQDLKVREFTMSKDDLYAAVHTKNDYNLEPCGVIRLSLADPNAKFEGNIMYDYLTYDHGEWIIYMEKGAKFLTIKTENYPPVHYNFPEGLEIKGNVTYIMVVQMPKPEMTVDEMIAQLQKAGYNISKDDHSSDNNGGAAVSALVAEGIGYYEAKNYTEALRCYRQAADQGDPEGQVRLGNMYSDGKGVAKDYAEAVKWYRMAADQGFAWGQKNLGLSYEYGEGVKQDYAEAVKWYRKAADQNYDKGQVNVGRMYYQGLGVKQDYTEAVKWFRKAADQGSAWGQCWIGSMYCDGTGVPQDYNEAIKWFRKAADQDDSDGQCMMGIMYDLGLGVTQDYAEAVKWYRKAADQDNADAQCNLGMMYEYGRGVQQDYNEAVKWYRKAAEQDNEWGQCNLGGMYEYGQGVSQSYTEAAKWYRKAAEQGNATAQRYLGWMYRKGQGVQQDYTEAMKWLRKAAEQGDTNSQGILGNMYEWGEGVAENPQEAVKWYRKAAEQEDVYGMYRLGYMYKAGLGVEQDFVEAARWFRKAAEKGDATSQWNLGELYRFGNGVPKDYTEALKWFRKAADQNNTMGLLWVGAMYEEGTGVPQDNVEAAKWYQKAADLGDESALEFLAGLKEQPSSEPVETSNGLTFTVEGVSFTMKLVEGGKFLMGAQNDKPNGKNYDSEAGLNESPIHSVTISTFYMGETEVTQALWYAVMRNNPSEHKGDDFPVEIITWHDCQEFIRKLNQMTNKHFRLPTEAEWEYAARGGKNSKGYKYAGSNRLYDVAWYWRNSGDKFLSGDFEYGIAAANNSKTHPVKTLLPNELGLYDMSGNVWEMCSDWNGGKVYYEKSPSKNPQGPSDGWERIMRGGAYNNTSNNCRVACRATTTPDDGGPIMGFRLALYN